MTEMTPYISIIVPVYNAGIYIGRCIDSILSQTFTDFELIIINDGSTDNSECICRTKAETDSRIKCISQINSGASQARNTGLFAAKGTWIMFVDADDTLKPHAISLLVNFIKDNVDIAMAGYDTIRNGLASNNKQQIKNIVQSGSELMIQLFEPTDYPYMGYVWAKLFRNGIIRQFDIKFDRAIQYNEDRLFVFQYMMHCKKGAYTNAPIYEYNEYDGNTMSAIEGPNFWKFETDLDAFVKMNKLVQHLRSSRIVQSLHYAAWLSYNWNKRLNKQYGNNNRRTAMRLLFKILSIISFKKYCHYMYSNWKYKISKKINEQTITSKCR